MKKTDSEKESPMLPRLSFRLRLLRSPGSILSGRMCCFRGTSGEFLFLIVCLLLGVIAGLFLKDCGKREDEDFAAAARKKIQLSYEFCIAASEGDLKKIRILVEKNGISPDFPRLGLPEETPLSLAVKKRRRNT